ncbi:MAG TPA: MFS transporter [Chloroflexota bacterium]|nr:MFS transporter [Chloroflexota bacterium]
MSRTEVRRDDSSSPEPENQAPRRLRDRGKAIATRTFESLQEPDFRILWFGFMGSWFAMQMQQVARGYLAYELTGNALALGLVTLAMGLPRIVLSPVGGVLADRFTKRSVLLYTQAALGLIALFQALLLSFHLMTIEWLIFAGFLQGTAFSFNMPARQAYLPAVVGTGDKLANALALNNAGMNFTRVMGPALAGALIAVPFIDVPGIFYIIAVCYIWVWWSVYRVRNPGRAEAARRSVGRSLGDGFSYVFKRPQLLALMSLGFVPLAIGMPYISLMPVVALHDLDIGSVGLGLLLSAGGIGSLCGTLGVAYFSNYPRKAFLQQILGVVFGITLVGFGFFAVKGLILPALPCLFIAGMSGDAYMALNSTLVMIATERGVYGRVMGVYMMAQSVRPITVLPISAIADAVGTSLTILGCGAICAVFVFAVAALYPGYRDIGSQESAEAVVI